MRGFFTSTIDIMCGDYNEFTDKCQQLGPPPIVANSNANETYSYASYMFVLVDLLESMETFQQEY